MINKDVFTHNIELLHHINPQLAKKVMQKQETESCYGESFSTRTGDAVSCFTNGQAMFSKYNPQREAESFFTPQSADSVFIAISGMGSAQHIHAILKNTNVRVMAIEKNAASIKTLCAQNDFSELFAHPHFFLTTADLADSALVSWYIPQLHGNFQHMEQRSWCIFNDETEQLIIKKLQAGLAQISADYSIQSHFGRVWMRNILQNLQNIANTKPPHAALPLQKTAAIIAAGPSLDVSIHHLAEKRAATFIIATDTAAHILLNHGIVPDAVVSIDGQNISYQHFMAQLPSKDTVFVLDICAHPAAAIRAAENGNPVVFAKSAHPLCAVIDSFAQQHGTKPFPTLDTTSGTVTIAALDFAVQSGFSHIMLYGADFAYTHHKPYARGSYLETAFSRDALRLNPSETAFVRLMYRTEITRINKDTTTTQVLRRYADSLDEYVQHIQRNISIEKDTGKDIQNISSHFSRNMSHQTKEISDFSRFFFTEKLYNSFNYADFIVWLTDQIANTELSSNYAILAALLPLAAWCEKHDMYKSGKDSFAAVRNFALELIKRYSGELI